MASKNKKNKAKNSFLYGGAEKYKGMKLRRIAYYMKADRTANKILCKEER